ncbi:Predicted arabinose efflux permease, MFS family [Amycolatopsis pretoriensis]|uniref:Predicted arabinose efflux permease, MFS family n=1 Tax=Amycolatopsis pretoriensis TaxID=218821 RepID=A0A1H5Q397_9PSEU|nr:MFS transporter [Amycolatopsis pretoriensis]SEF19891.1 Predicted arabinose efflux permease, MFS family [Amycolatopsis pretoriensis]
MGRGRRLLLAVVCGVAVAGVYAGQPVLGPMGDDLGVPRDSVGWFVAVGQLGYLAGLVLLVPLGDRLDRRRLIAVHLGLVAAGLAVTAAAPVAWVAFGGLAVAGLFAVVVQTTVAYAASIAPPAERGRTLGVVTSGVVAGILGARVLTGTLADLGGWRGSYVALAVLAAVLSLLCLVFLPADGRTATESHRRILGSLAGLFTRPLFLSRGLIAFFLFASFGTLWSGMALPLAGEPWRLSETQIGLFGAAGLAGALGAARAGRWGDAGHAGRVTGLALVLLLGSWLAIGQLGWSLPLPAFGVLLLDFAVQVVHVANQHALTTAFPGRTSTVIGGYMVFYSLGSAAGAAATTAVYAVAGWPGSTVLGAALAGAALVTWAVAARGARAGSRLRTPSGGRRGPAVPGPAGRRRRPARPGPGADRG